MLFYKFSFKFSKTSLYSPSRHIAAYLQVTLRLPKITDTYMTLEYFSFNDFVPRSCSHLFLPDFKIIIYFPYGYDGFVPCKSQT